MFDINFPERPKTSLKLYEYEGHWKESGQVYREEKLLTGDVWDAYADGYLEAVGKLIINVEDNEFFHDTFGYPIFFLFYHYLEIRMKEIIKNGRDLIDEPPNFSKGHDLIQLWGECKRILKKLEGWTEYNELDDETRRNYLTIDHFIKEIGIDNYAQSFRYPVDRDGNPLLSSQQIQTLNVHNLAIVVKWLSFLLEGISTGIDEERKNKREISAENFFEGLS